MTPDYLTTDHLLAIAPTGRKTRFGGKSSWANWFADGPARSRELIVWANFKHDDVAGVLDDFVEVASVEELGAAVGRGARRLILTPDDHDWPAVSRRLEAFVRAAPSDLGKVVLLDEVPELDDDAVLSFVRVHGNGASCQTVALAQSPTDVDGSILKQTTPLWIGPVPTSYRAWFRTHDFDHAYRHIEQNHDPYEWSVLLGPDEGDADHFAAVSEDYVV